MTSREIRQSFFDFFAAKGHTIVPSAPVIPGDDPTLLFTNAGMNQFKDVFLGSGSRPYTRAVDTQKCIRVSGKHNDLEEVGRDTYHHTFFEMLGNWSFGDYYKREAIAWAWELLTNVWKLPKQRLWATVYKDDDEAEALWKEVTDIDPTHVLRFGEKDNFWEMGDTGPCGPCSEIHVDLTPAGNAEASKVNAGTPDVIEIWNLVFIQYDRDGTGELHPLPAKHVDTGMGFERICAVLQKKSSNYDSDVFTPLILKVSEISATPYDGRIDGSLRPEQVQADTAMRVIADHIRTLTFAIADGAIPSNEGRGYVLRRILRRAARFGRSIGLREPFLHRLVGTLSETMGDVFPEIVRKREHVERLIKGEEESFNATLDRGLEEFEKLAEGRGHGVKGVLSGEDAFRLYDTFGFPFDLTALMAHERGLSVDEQGFNEALAAQRERSREGVKTERTLTNLREIQKGLDRQSTIFSGYNAGSLRATVTSISEPFLTLDRTPFFAESGGQIGDTGIIVFGNHRLKIVDTQKDGDVIGHRYVGIAGPLLGNPVDARIDEDRRLNITRNHTATHIVHEALRRVLGGHLHQQGSLVADTHLRFDFNHFERVTPEKLQAIEEMVNERIGENITVNALNDPSEWVSIDEAKKRWPNVKMFFGEKYGDRVRVVEIDPSFSVELCGGTHVGSTSDIGYFAFRSEGSVASGIRRIDAVTGDGALLLAEHRGRDLLEKTESATALVDGLFSRLADAGRAANEPEWNARRDNLASLAQKLERFNTSVRTGSGLRTAFRTLGELDREAESLLLAIASVRKTIERTLEKDSLKQAASDITSLVGSAGMVEGFKVVAAQVAVNGMDALKSAGDTLRLQLGSGIGVLATVIDDKVQVVCVVTDDLIAAKGLKAGAIVGIIAKELGGGGGGRPHLATAGGKDVTKVTEVLASVPKIVRSFL